MIQACNPSNWKVETGGLQDQGQSGLHNENLSQKTQG
jgi:hypothetical protein